MLPLETLDSLTTHAGNTLSLEKRGDELFIRKGLETITSSQTLDAGLVLAELTCHPIRSARQPKILIASRSMGELTAGALNVVTQKKGQIVIHDSDPRLALWQKQYFSELYPEILTDTRIISTTTPLEDLITSTPEGWHGIAVDLDHLAATNPESMSLFTTETGLKICADNLRDGSVLGITQIEHDKKLLNTLGKAGFNPETDSLPITAKARRSKMRTVILAKHGDYIPRSEMRKQYRKK